MMRPTNNIAAFTLFEVTMVLAIMGILVSIIAITLNRFNEQLKNSTQVQAELNDWYLFRSNLWRELYQSDSLKLNNDILAIYHSSDSVLYTIEDDTLKRKSGKQDWASTHFEASGLREEILGGKHQFVFEFPWKNEVMHLRYSIKKTIKNQVDTYFDSLQ